MESEYPGPVNLGNPDEMTILEFAEFVLDRIESQSSVVHRELPVDDPKVRKPNISLAIEKLGWKPVVGLEEGMERTIEYFRSKKP